MITIKDVEHVAKLARLELTPDEKELFADQLSKIIDAFDELKGVPTDGVELPKGLGSRHMAAAGISRHTKAIAYCVSQSTGSVQVFQDGEVKLRIEPLARPHVWQPLRLETHEADDNGDGG